MPIYMVALALAFTLTVTLENISIPRLRRFAKQPIYTEGPSWHEVKRGTPTMGGISFVIASAVALIIGAIYFSRLGERTALSLITVGAYAIGNALVGLIDDLVKLKRRENGGLTPRAKLILQSLLAVLFIFSRHSLLSEKSIIYFSGASFDIGPLYYLLAFFMLIATVNCANLTDGVDGLASGVAFAIGISLFYISYSQSPDTALVGIVQAGVSLAFLIFNINPARIFMGDTGSLFFGATLGGCAIALGNPLIVLVLGSVYLIEGVSVIIQVLGFKATKRRVFKMAPIHHHLEKCGFSENKIVVTFMLITLASSLLSVVLFV